MFVAALDRPWLETPFLVQGFVIKELSEIRKLKEFCNYVYVEKEGRRWGGKFDHFKPGFAITKRNVTGAHESRMGKRSEPKITLASSVQSRKSYPVEHSVVREHNIARRTYKFARHTVTGLLEQARMGAALETQSAKLVVDHCVKSIIRNPHALMWMAKIKHADEYTLEHCLNVSILAIAFGRHLRLEEAELEKLGLCGLLHDVGKMQIPSEILNKTEPLSKEEFDLLKQHTVFGRDLLLQREDAMQYVVDAAYNHHERIDGKGYPRGLVGPEISEYARIISIVDAFDAMTSERCYDGAKSSLEGLKEIYRHRGTQFDEELALEFIQLIGPFPPGTLVELRNGYVGVVLSSQEKKRHLPLVRILLDQNKQRQPPEEVDLVTIEKGLLPSDFLISHVLKDGDFGLRLEEHTDEVLKQSVQQDTQKE